MAVTIYDIAREAGVSPSTVSLAMNNSNKIKASTTMHIHEVAKRLGYAPNFAARSLTNSQTYNIGVIMPNLSNPLFSSMLEEIVNTATGLGYGVVLGLSDQSIEKEKQYIAMLSEQLVDGILILPTFLDDIFPEFIKGKNDADIPMILCGASTEQSKNIGYVKCDNHMGGYIATEHLIQSGKRRIACLCAVKERTQATSRVAGYRDAHEFYGIPFSQELVSFCAPDNESIRAETVRLITEQNVDSFFCLFDYMCLPVIRAIETLGKKIPEDIAIVGYDNIDIASMLPIPLTSVETHSRQIGSMAVNQLVKKIKDSGTETRRIVLKPELIVRASSKLD